MSISIGWALEDVTAREDATPSVSENMAFANISDFNMEAITPPKAATLEERYWRLDGSFVPFPDAPEYASWGLFAPTLSGEDGSLATPITLTIGFTAYHSSAGITLLFSAYENLYADDVAMAWYRGETLLAEARFAPNRWRYAHMQTVENYDRLVITFYHLNHPRSYLRLTGIIYGTEQTFQETELTAATLLEAMDFTGDSLPQSRFSFSLHSRDLGLNILNPTGLYSLLQKRQALTLLSEEGNLGTFFLSDWSQQGEHLFHMEGCDALGVMEDTIFAGGLYQDVSAATLAETIFTEVGFGYNMEETLAQKNVSGWLPRCSHREALRQLCFAIGAAVDTSGGGNVRLFSMNPEAIGIFPRAQKVAGESKTLLDPIVTGVEVTGHSYVLPDSTTKLFKGNLSAGEQDIYFSGPCKVTAVTGATLKSQTVNHATLQVSTQGEVVVTGYRYEDNTLIAKAGDPIPGGEKAHVLTVTDATLVSLSTAQTVADKLYQDCKCRLRQTMTLLPGLHTLGAAYAVENMQNAIKSGYLIEAETDFCGGGLRKVVILGE